MTRNRECWSRRPDSPGFPRRESISSDNCGEVSGAGAFHVLRGSGNIVYRQNGAVRNRLSSLHRDQRCYKQRRLHSAPSSDVLNSNGLWSTKVPSDLHYSLVLPDLSSSRSALRPL
jgi:hypothetical protein